MCSPEDNLAETTHSSIELIQGYSANDFGSFSPAEPTQSIKIEPTDLPEDDSFPYSLGPSEPEEPHKIYRYAPDPKPEQDVLVELLNFYDVRSTSED